MADTSRVVQGRRGSEILVKKNCFGCQMEVLGMSSRSFSASLLIGFELLSWMQVF